MRENLDLKKTKEAFKNETLEKLVKLRAEKDKIEGEKTMKSILEVLKEHDLKFDYDESDSEIVVVHDNEFLSVCEEEYYVIPIIAGEGKIIFRLQFLFKAQENATLFLMLLANEYNYGKAFAKLDVEPESGKIYMEYTYLMRDSRRFDKEDFWIYMTSLIVPARKMLAELLATSIGIVPKNKKLLYKILLRESLEALEEECDIDDEIGDIDSEIDKGLSLIEKETDKAEQNSDKGGTEVFNVFADDEEENIGVIPDDEGDDIDE